MVAGLRQEMDEKAPGFGHRTKKFWKWRAVMFV